MKCPICKHPPHEASRCGGKIYGVMACQCQYARPDSIRPSVAHAYGQDREFYRETSRRRSENADTDLESVRQFTFTPESFSAPAPFDTPDSSSTDSGGD